MDEVIKPVTVPNFADRSRHKPIYILISEDVNDSVKLDYYYSTKIDKNEFGVVLRGHKISKAQAEKLGKSRNAELSAKTDLIEVELPWHMVKRIDNLTFRIAQKEKK